MNVYHTPEAARKANSLLMRRTSSTVNSFLLRELVALIKIERASLETKKMRPEVEGRVVNKQFHTTPKILI